MESPFMCLPEELRDHILDLVTDVKLKYRLSRISRSFYQRVHLPHAWHSTTTLSIGHTRVPGRSLVNGCWVANETVTAALKALLKVLKVKKFRFVHGCPTNEQLDILQQHLTNKGMINLTKSVEFMDVLRSNQQHEAQRLFSFFIGAPLERIEYWAYMNNSLMALATEQSFRQLVASSGSLTEFCYRHVQRELDGAVVNELQGKPISKLALQNVVGLTSAQLAQICNSFTTELTELEVTKMSRGFGFRSTQFVAALHNTHALRRIHIDLAAESQDAGSCVRTLLLADTQLNQIGLCLDDAEPVPNVLRETFNIHQNQEPQLVFNFTLNKGTRGDVLVALADDFADEDVECDEVRWIRDTGRRWAARAIKGDRSVLFYV